MVDLSKACSVSLALLPAAFAPVPGVAHSALAQADAMFEPDVTYDTVVVRGTLAEAEPRFVYGELSLVQLVDSTTVLLGDKASGHLVYADLRTGEGWEVGGGGDGPGEFGGQPPLFTSSGEFIYTAANLQGATWTADGELLETVRYRESYRGVGQFPMALMNSGVVVTYRTEFPSQEGEGEELEHEIRAYSRDFGLRWVHPLPPIEVRSEEGPRGRPRIVQDGVVTVHARHETVVWTRNRGTLVVALDADGTERGRRNLEYAVYLPFVAADGSIWVRVRAPNARQVSSWLVLNRDLEVVTRVTEHGIVDAWGDYALALSFDDTGLQLLTLLRARG